MKLLGRRLQRPNAFLTIQIFSQVDVTEAYLREISQSGIAFRKSSTPLSVTWVR